MHGTWEKTLLIVCLLRRKGLDQRRLLPFFFNDDDDIKNDLQRGWTAACNVVYIIGSSKVDTRFPPVVPKQANDVVPSSWMVPALIRLPNPASLSVKIGLPCSCCHASNLDSCKTTIPSSASGLFQLLPRGNNQRLWYGILWIRLDWLQSHSPPIKEREHDPYLFCDLLLSVLLFLSLILIAYSL
jgi:hypothetical protein